MVLELLGPIELRVLNPETTLERKNVPARTDHKRQHDVRDRRREEATGELAAGDGAHVFHGAPPLRLAQRRQLIPASETSMEVARTNISSRLAARDPAPPGG